MNGLKNRKQAWIAVAACAAVCLALAPAAVAQEVANVRVGSGGIDFEPLVANGGTVLTVSGPEDFHFRAEFTASESPGFSIYDQAGGLLPDGSYHWELTASPTDGQRRDALEANQALEKSRGIQPLIQTGAFSIVNGAVVAGGGTEPGTEGDRVGGNRLATKTTVLTTADGTIINSLCVGTDCTSSESFGFDTLRLKENNTRIDFTDTSNSGSFPTRDWEIEANGSNNGDPDYLRVEDSDAGTSPFTIEGPAQNNSVWVDSSGNVGGNVGFGTSTPVVDLHVVSGNTPTLRLEQNSSSGFAAQTWDVAGNETNFFVRDTTNGSRIPFKIIPSAPTNSLYVANNGNVGVGTASPGQPVHVKRSNGTANVTVEDTSTGVVEELSLIVSGTNGRPRLSFTNPDGTWFYEVNGTNFEINRSGSGSPEELLLETNGDMTIGGMLTELSSRAAKQEFVELDPVDVLDRVVDLPVLSWSYTADEQAARHVGPMAEDFYQAFALGDDDTHIAPGDKAGIALLAIQGLSRVIEEKDARIEALEQRLAALEEAKKGE